MLGRLGGTTVVDDKCLAVASVKLLLLMRGPAGAFRVPGIVPGVSSRARRVDVVDLVLGWRSGWPVGQKLFQARDLGTLGEGEWWRLVALGLCAILSSAEGWPFRSNNGWNQLVFDLTCKVLV